MEDTQLWKIVICFAGFCVWFGLIPGSSCHIHSLWIRRKHTVLAGPTVYILSMKFFHFPRDSGEFALQLRNFGFERMPTIIAEPHCIL